MTRVQLEPAYLLHHRAYRETSALLEIFSAGRGRVGLVARGARSPKSKSRSLFQPFQRLLLSWSDRGELGTLTGAEADGRPEPLGGEAVFSGWYLNELLLRTLTRHDAHAELFEHYASTLSELAAGATAASLRRFELRLLENLGYGLQLTPDLDPDGWYDYHAETGARPCGEQPGAIRGASLMDIAADHFESPQTLRDARNVLRAALAPYLGDRPLQTPRMLRALRAARGPREETIHA